MAQIKRAICQFVQSKFVNGMKMNTQCSSFRRSNQLCVKEKHATMEILSNEIRKKIEKRNTLSDALES